MSIQSDIKSMLAESGWTQRRLAAVAGVNEAALSKLMTRKGESIVERIHPFVWGEKRPSGKNPTPSTSTPESDDAT